VGVANSRRDPAALAEFRVLIQCLRPAIYRIDWLNRPNPLAQNVPSQPADNHRGARLQSEAYHITVDDGADSFCALSIESPENDQAWLISDTVTALESIR